MIKETLKKDNDYQCTNNYRNADSHRVILRYIKNELHVYLKSLSSDNYEYCFSVNVGIDTKKYYIALSAMTGQVADKHDIFLLITRYLDASDAQKIDDARLKRAGYRGRRISWKSVLFWLLITFLNIFLCYEIIYEYWEFSRLQTEQLSPVILAQRLNGHIYTAYIIHSIVIILIILAGKWKYFIINLPFIGWRGYQYMINNVKLEAIKLRKARNTFDVGKPIGSSIKGAILAISLIMSIIRIFSA